MVEKIFKILPHRGVGILVDGERGRGIQNTHTHHADFKIAQLRQRVQQLLHDE